MAAEDGHTNYAWAAWIGSQPQQGADAAYLCVLRVTLPPAGSEAHVSGAHHYTGIGICSAMPFRAAWAGI
jgi:hypothetical protein